MYCNKCGREISENSSFCKYCGNKMKSDSNKRIASPQKVLDGKKKKKKKKDSTGAIALTLILLIGLGIGIFALYQSGNNPVSGFVDSVVKNDEDLIVGSWKMDTSEYGEGLEAIASLHDKIVLVTFYSDGTCTVGQGVNAESGTWSITDETLIIKGDIGGMFWKYNGFASPYSLEGDVLTVYHDNSTDVYYRE